VPEGQEEVIAPVSSDEVEKLKAELKKVKDEMKAATKKITMMDGFMKQTLGKRFSDMTVDEKNAFMDHKITFIEYEEPEEDEEEDEDKETLESFLKARENNDEWWWTSSFYSHEMYLKDKKTYTQTWNGCLSWKLSKWYENDYE
jgi:hypothetical protein